MARAHIYKVFQNADGSVMAGATVRVLSPESGDPITDTLFTTDAGSSTLENPFISDDGKAEFYLDIPQRLRLGITPPGGVEFFVITDVFPRAESVVVAAVDHLSMGTPVIGFVPQVNDSGQIEYVDPATLGGASVVKGVWSPTETYGINDVVVGSDNAIYVSLADDNLNNDPTTDGGVHWTATPASGGGGGAGSPGLVAIPITPSSSPGTMTSPITFGTPIDAATWVGDPSIADILCVVTDSDSEIAVPGGDSPRHYSFSVQIIASLTHADGSTPNHAYDGQFVVLTDGFGGLPGGPTYFVGHIEDATFKASHQIEEVFPPLYAFPADGTHPFDWLQYDVQYSGGAAPTMLADSDLKIEYSNSYVIVLEFPDSGGSGGGSDSDSVLMAVATISSGGVPVVMDSANFEFTSVVGGSAWSGDAAVGDLDAVISPDGAQLAVPAGTGLGVVRYNIAVSLTIALYHADGTTPKTDYDGDTARLSVMRNTLVTPVDAAPFRTDATIPGSDAGGNTIQDYSKDFEEIIPPSYAFSANGDYPFDHVFYSVEWAGGPNAWYTQYIAGNADLKVYYSGYMAITAIPT